LAKVKDLIKDKEDLKMIVELGKEAARAGVNVGVMYQYGLGNVKDLIKDKEDLRVIGKEIVKLGKKAVEAREYVVGVYERKLRKRAKELKKKKR